MTNLTTGRLFSGLAIAALLQCTSNAALIHHWEFNEGTGATTADSAGANPGAIDGATWATGTGDRASYLQFDGTDDRVVPSLVMSTISQADSSSWAFWVNPTSLNNNDIIIGNRRDGAGADIGPGTRNFLKITAASNFNFHQGTNKSVLLGDQQLFAIGEWTHFAFSRTGDQLTWYINGVVQNGGAAATIPGLDATPSAAMLPFYIGGEPNQNASEHFNGGIDDVRIYDNAISAQDVIDISGVPEPSSTLLFGLGGLALLRRRRK